MQTITIKKQFGLLTLAAILIVPLFGTSSLASAQTPSRGTVSDAAGNMVRSDGGGTYIDSVDCVTVQIAPPGFYQLRTVQNSGVCNGETSHRYLILDFGTGTPGDLDGNGVAQAQEFAPCRFVFNDAFVRKATTTPVHIYVLKVNPDGTTTQATAWDVEYRNPAHIVINGDGSRTLSLTTSEATADLYMISSLPHGKTQSTFVGTYNLPFSVVAQ